jgi:hypothetical protein
MGKAPWPLLSPAAAGFFRKKPGQVGIRQGAKYRRKHGDQYGEGKYRFDNMRHPPKCGALSRAAAITLPLA